MIYWQIIFITFKIQIIVLYALNNLHNNINMLCHSFFYATKIGSVKTKLNCYSDNMMSQ